MVRQAEISGEEIPERVRIRAQLGDPPNAAREDENSVERPFDADR